MTFDRGLRMLNRARIVGRYVSHEQVTQQRQVQQVHKCSAKDQSSM